MSLTWRIMRGTSRPWRRCGSGVKVRLLMRQAEQDGEHIWLRQSVTFTVAGQTRTVEIAIPLRPGATADEVEALLREADAGMEQLSRRLNDRVSALLGAAQSATPTGDAPAPVSAPTPNPREVSEPAPSPREVSAPAQRPEPAPPAVAAPVRPPARVGRDVSTPTRTPVPSASPARPAAQPAARNTAPTAPTSPTTPAPARAQASGPLVSGSASQGPDLTRQQFISAAQEMGLSVKVAMDRLGVRTLEGLNLREALEALRRQAVQSDTPLPFAPPFRRPVAPDDSPASAEPRYFDEEDDLDVTFSVDGEDGAEEEFASYATGGPHDRDDLDPLDEIEELDLDDDVPDFGPPPSAARGSSSAPRRHTAAPPAAAPVPDVASPGAALAGASGDRAHALQLVGQMRSARGGGAPSGYQRTAYRNVIARELGEPEAAALVRGLWRTTPDRLSGEQLDALLSWGKQDTFGEEAALVLAELRAERERANATSPASEQPSASEPPRTAPRSRGASSGRSAPGGR